ncbi:MULTISPECIES: DUF7659 family protein [Staphylococcaceae]|uniref:Uncharacterized protein n=1 Tax=Staphylococcus equorum TaxID=246432 RepID=A0AAP7IFP1_9STAP|nr:MULTISPECIES: hypothetical protein [Staphylococcaceae]OEK59120.1 hypothetical protein ASS94_00200 [Staphylococcus equorum]
METYLELKKRHKADIDNFPMFFAFSNEQLEEGKTKIGCESNEELVSIGAGGYIKKQDKQDFIDMMKQQEKEHFNNMLESDNKANYVYGMVQYELANHEFAYTYERADAIEACGITKDMLESYSDLNTVVNQAVSDYKVKVAM